MITDIKVSTNKAQITNSLLEICYLTLEPKINKIYPNRSVSWQAIGKIENHKPGSLKAKPKRSSDILLFSLKSNSEGEQLLVTKSGKEYLEKINLWRDMQIKIAKQLK